MGWLSYLLLGDLGQQLSLNDQEAEIARLRAEVISTRTSAANKNIEWQVENLQRENDELRLYVTALTRLLVNTNVIAREDLEGLVRAVDAEDGQVDGRYAAPLG